MKKTAMTLLSMPILMMMLILGMNPEASASGTKDIIIMQCSSGPAGPPPMGPSGFEVLVVTPSAGVTDVDILVGPGSNCAQALADSLSAGFTIRKIQGEFGGLTFVLKRKH